LRLPDDAVVQARPGHQIAIADVLRLVAPYVGARTGGPDLLTPRPLLRIIPGKLHGEPHVAGTRIPSAMLFGLARQGYGIEAIRRMYPDASDEAIEQAINLEESLQSSA